MMKHPTLHLLIFALLFLSPIPAHGFGLECTNFLECLPFYVSAFIYLLIYFLWIVLLPLAIILLWRYRSNRRKSFKYYGLITLFVGLVTLILLANTLIGGAVKELDKRARGLNNFGTVAYEPSPIPDGYEFKEISYFRSHLARPVMAFVYTSREDGHLLEFFNYNKAHAPERQIENLFDKYTERYTIDNLPNSDFNPPINCIAAIPDISGVYIQGELMGCEVALTTPGGIDLYHVIGTDWFFFLRGNTIVSFLSTLQNKLYQLNRTAEIVDTFEEVSTEELYRRIDWCCNVDPLVEWILPFVRFVYDPVN